MAETIVISCPECGKQLRVPEEAAGKKIRCKGCEHVFTVESPGKSKPAKAPAKAAAPKPAPAKPGKPAKPAPAKPPASKDDDEEDGKAYGVTELDLAPRCPECANEMESAEAIICLHCGFNIQTREKAQTRKVAETTGGDIFLWLLPGILAVIAILCLIGYAFFHWFGLPGMMVKDWEELLNKYDGKRVKALSDDKITFIEFWVLHPSLYFFLWLFTLWASWKLGYFAFKRLVLENKPPEIEVGK